MQTENPLRTLAPGPLVRHCKPSFMRNGLVVLCHLDVCCYLSWCSAACHFRTDPLLFALAEIKTSLQVPVTQFQQNKGKSPQLMQASPHGPERVVVTTAD